VFPVRYELNLYMLCRRTVQILRQPARFYLQACNILEQFATRISFDSEVIEVPRFLRFPRNNEVEFLTSSTDFTLSRTSIHTAMQTAINETQHDTDTWPKYRSFVEYTALRILIASL
jgi:hypothetical protein